MGKFTEQNLKLKYGERLLFGNVEDTDDAYIQSNNSGLSTNAHITDSADYDQIINDGHLITKQYYDIKTATISGDITTYVDDEVASIRASRGGTTFYFQDIESADVAGYEILGTTPGGQPEDTDVLTITSASGSVLLGQYVTVSGSPNTTLIPGGEWTFTIWAKVSNTGGTSTITTKVYKRSEAGAETELFTSTTADINGTSATAYVTTTTQTGVELLATDRIVMKHYAQTTSVPAITITYYYEGTEHYSRVATPVVVQSISDHGQLSGLADDDHTQYLNTTRGDARYYTETEVDSISGAINSKFSSYLTTAQFTTSSGDIVDQIPTDYISDAEMTVISGDIIGQIPSDYVSDSEMTTISGDIVDQIPTDYISDAEMTTISGDIVAQFPTPGIANIVEDTTPQLGGNLDLNNFSISYTVSPSSNQTAVGDIATLTVDTNGVGFGCALYMASDGNFDEADADAVATMPCVALATATGTGSIQVLLRGFIRDDAWTWTPGGMIYVSTTQGTLTQTAPTGNSDVVQVVGFATHADRMYFNPSYNTIVLVA